MKRGLIYLGWAISFCAITSCNGLAALAADLTAMVGDVPEVKGIRFERSKNPGDECWSELYTNDELDDNVEASITKGDTIFIGGRFTRIGSARCSYVAMWDGNRWCNLGSGVNGYVYAMAIGPDGMLYVGGNFSVAGGSVARNMARWDGSAWTEVDGGVNGIVYAMVFKNDTLIIGGTFTKADTIDAVHVAQLSGSEWKAIGGVPSTWVIQAFATDGTRLYAAGSHYVFSWNESSWDVLSSAPFNSIYCLAIYSNELYAGGQSSTGCHLGKWSGSNWVNIGSELFANDAYVKTLLVSSSYLYIGGWFFSEVGRTADMARWNGTSILYFPSVEGYFQHAYVNTISDYQGKLVVGGHFTVAGGVRTINIGCWDTIAWSTIGHDRSINTYPPYQGYAPWARALVSTDSGVIVAGNFDRAGGKVASHVALVSDTSWKGIGDFGSNPTVAILAMDNDTGQLFVTTDWGRNVYRWDGTSWSSIGALAGTNRCYGNAVLRTGGQLYVGGMFSQLSGVSSVAIARWDGTNWFSLQGGVYNGPSPNDAEVMTVGSWDGGIIVGGRFGTAGTTPANRIARWDGTSWHAMGDGLNSAPWSLLSTDSCLYVGGEFTASGASPLSHIAKWNGTAWIPLGAGLNGGVYALATDGQKLYAGGVCAPVGTGGMNGVCEWDGTTWVKVGTGFNGVIRAMTVQNGYLYVAGDFRRAGERTCDYLTRMRLAEQVRLISPVGGESFPSGTTQLVKWRGGGPDVDHWDISLSTNGGATYETMLATGIAPSESTFAWSVPSRYLPHCRIKIVGVSSSGNELSSYLSDRDFSIYSHASILTPNGGEVLVAGSPYVVSWKVYGSGFYGYRLLHARVRAEQDGRALIKSIVVDTVASFIPGGDTVFLWTVPSIIENSNYLKLEMIDTDGFTISRDTSDGFFAIHDADLPSVSLRSPNGGEKWEIRSTHTVLWSQYDNIGVLVDSVFFSTDNGISWSNVWSGLDTSLNWVVPDLPSTQCLIKLIVWDRDGNCAEDVCDTTFTISDLPREYRLRNGYPNPGKTNINFRYDLPENSSVTFEFYNVTGQILGQYNIGQKPPGFYLYTWNCENAVSGVYFCRMIAGPFRKVQRLVVIK